jgi:enamine deaminase RidA (YjgF/YER057c/UK114 family)
MAQHSQVQYFMEAVEKQLGFAASVHVGNTIYLSGIISVNEKIELVAPGDMAGQITQIYDNMEKVLALSGATLANVVNELMFATDMKALAEAAHVRARRYAHCAPPANTAVQVAGLFIPGAMLEIQATAIVE